MQIEFFHLVHMYAYFYSQWLKFFFFCIIVLQKFRRKKKKKVEKQRNT